MNIFQVDAFSDRPFGGNPAAVCVLTESKPDDWMLQLAQEMNLSETAFLLPENDGYRLRWFTPAVEVNLCGHATLASAHVLWSEGLLKPEQSARFYTRSGPLTAQLNQGWIELDFPAAPPQALAQVPAGLGQALGIEVDSAWKDDAVNYLLVEVATPEIVSSLKPDFVALGPVHSDGIIVTAPVTEPVTNPITDPSQTTDDSPYDFVSRFFAPAYGIDEDPVTGSAHCVLGPYWGDRLQKSELLAYQCSARGGVVKVKLGTTGAKPTENSQQKAEESDRCDRIILSGQAVTVFKGDLCA